MTTYRVDRVMERRVPCGMNSILYYGKSAGRASAAFETARVGLDPWNQENPAYGVVLSIWDGFDYVIKREKGLA